MPQMGYDTKTDKLTDCQSQCDFDLQSTQTIRTSTKPVSTSRYLLSVQPLLHLRDNSTATCPGIAGRQEARVPAWRAPNLYQPCRPVPISEALHSRPPQHTNPTQRNSADYPLAARRTSPVAVRAAPGNLPYTLRTFSGPPSTVPTNQRGQRRGSPRSIQNGPFQGHRPKQCRYRA
jgi:hypothetical protein